MTRLFHSKGVAHDRVSHVSKCKKKKLKKKLLTVLLRLPAPWRCKQLIADFAAYESVSAVCVCYRVAQVAEPPDCFCFYLICVCFYFCKYTPAWASGLFQMLHLMSCWYSLDNRGSDTTSVQVGCCLSSVFFHPVCLHVRVKLHCKLQSHKTMQCDAQFTPGSSLLLCSYWFSELNSTY